MFIMTYANFVLYFYCRNIKLPSDFPRRSRKYDHPTYKCHEWRQFSMYYFPIVVEVLELQKFREKSVFLSFGFLARAFRLPDAEYEELKEDDIREATNILADSYEAAYGITACNYNYHHVTAHLLKYRKKGPFTDFSAYQYEGTYAGVRRSFCPGTRKFVKGHFDICGAFILTFH